MSSFLIASACVVLVLSLPISATKAGPTLRRWAGVLLLLALTPAIFVGLVGAMGGSSGAPYVGTSAGSSVDALGTVLGFLTLSHRLRDSPAPQALQPEEPRPVGRLRRPEGGREEGRRPERGQARPAGRDVRPVRRLSVSFLDFVGSILHRERRRAYEMAVAAELPKLAPAKPSPDVMEEVRGRLAGPCALTFGRLPSGLERKE